MSRWFQPRQINRRRLRKQRERKIPKRICDVALVSLGECSARMRNERRLLVSTFSFPPCRPTGERKELSSGSLGRVFFDWLLVHYLKLGNER